MQRVEWLTKELTYRLDDHKYYQGKNNLSLESIKRYKYNLVRLLELKALLRGRI